MTIAKRPSESSRSDICIWYILFHGLQEHVCADDTQLDLSFDLNDNNDR